MRIPLPLALVLTLLASCSRSETGGGGEEGAWDLSKVPDAGATIREVQAPGGVVYRVTKEGQGESAKYSDVMDLTYKAYLLTGEEGAHGTFVGILSSRTRAGTPAGLQYGVSGMKVGERRRLLLSASMGWPQNRVSPEKVAGKRVVLDVERIPLLQVEVVELQAAAGREAHVGDHITVQYRGTTKDGKEFDSSYKRKKPFETELERGKLIEGWIRGIDGMRVGEKRLLRIPGALAYGDEEPGAPSGGPPRGELTFEVELLDVK